VLIDKHGYALLTDFGLSKENMTDAERANSLCGTAEYLAPEVLEKKRSYGKACDWWSFGCVIYEMLTGCPPFYSTNRQEMFQKIKKNEVVFKPFHTDDMRDLLSRLLIKDPNKRLSNAQEIMAHPFFAGVDWDLMMARKLATPYIPVLQD
jgi:serine/threonine protein kinase